MKKRSEVYQVEGAKQLVGAKLKSKRQSLGYSLGDMSDMTGFSKSTLLNLENGVATNIDYYITSAQALQLPLTELFDILIELKPRFELSADKKNRIFLSRKIRKLIAEDNFFTTSQSVETVIKRLEEKKWIVRSKESSTNTSRILLNLVDEGLLIVVEKQGRNNLYILSMSQE
jgi:transcriptional regulator with XRE-family HTH domain